MQLHFDKVQDVLYENKTSHIHRRPKHWVLFGEDYGNVLLLKQKIKSFYLKNLHFNIIYYEYDQIKHNVNKLNLELKSKNLFSSGTFIIIDSYPDSCNKDWEKILNDTTLTGSLLIVCNHLKRNNKMRKFIENTPHIAVINCYKKNREEIRRHIEQYFQMENMKCADGVLDVIANFLPPDSMLLESELEKLKSFCHKADTYITNKIIDLHVILQLLWDASELELEELCMSFVLGDVKSLMRCLKQIESNEINFILVLRVLQNYLIRLIDIKMKYNKGDGYHALIKLIGNARPPFFGKSRDNALNVLRTADLRRLRKLLFIVMKLELKCKSGIIKEPQLLLLRSILYHAT